MGWGNPQPLHALKRQAATVKRLEAERDAAVEAGRGYGQSVVDDLLTALRDARAENERVLAANAALREGRVDGDAESAALEWREAARQLVTERDALRAENADLRRAGAQARRDGFSQGRAAGEAAADLARRELAELRARIEALAERWRYKGEFGWGRWQEGEGPDHESYVLDGAAKELRAVLSLAETEPADA